MCLRSWESKSVSTLMPKAQSHLVTNCDRGVASGALLVALSGLEGPYQVTKSEIYLGARPLQVLNVSSKISKSILNLTGSQCREVSTGVMCLFF